MDPKSYVGIFMGYSTNNGAYRVFNSITKSMMESINVVVDDNISKKGTNVESDVETSFQQINLTENEEVIESDSESGGVELDKPEVKKGPSIRIQKDNPIYLIIGNLNE